jgi:hypothetical protein
MHHKGNCGIVMKVDTLNLVGKARELFGDTLEVGDFLPHVKSRKKGAYTCPGKVNTWRKPINLHPYYPNDWLVGCEVCKTAQWRFARYRGGWTLRVGGIPHLLPLCPLDVREDLLMLTDSRFPEQLCPWTIDEENGILVAKNGKAMLILTCEFFNASEGYRIVLRDRKKYWMCSGRKEREIMKQVAEQCPTDTNVLVGGLGLGVIVLELCKRKVKTIQIWEISRDIILLVYPKLYQWCRKYYPDVRLEMVLGDVRAASGRFDFVFYDIWDNDSSKHQPLIQECRKLGEKLSDKVICWQEDRIMGTDQFGVNSKEFKIAKEAFINSLA